MAKAKKKSSRSSSKRSKTNKSRSGFTPEELRFFPRFIASKIGRWVIAVLAVLLLLTLNVLIAGKKVDRFFVMTGIELLIGIFVFWILLLYKRASKAA